MGNPQTVRMTPLALGPEHGTLTLSTGVEGRAAKAGHSLTIALSSWTAEVGLEGQVPVSLAFRTPLASLEVTAGKGGLKPLSDKDRRTIKESALETLSAQEHPEVVFTSSAVAPEGTGYVVDGTLEVAGVARPARLTVEVVLDGGAATLSGRTDVVQTEHGVKPYSAMMGGLRVRDRVDVALTATVALP